MFVNLNAIIVCIYFILLSSSYSFAQRKDNICEQGENAMFLIDYVNCNDSEQRTSALFLHFQDKIIQLRGKAVNQDSVGDATKYISINALYGLSDEGLLHFLDTSQILEYQMNNVFNYYKISDVDIYFLKGLEFYKITKDGEKIFYADLQDSPNGIKTVKKLPNGSIKIDPAKAYGSRTFVKSKDKISCFIKYEIVAQQGKHSASTYWIPEVGVLQEREAGYAAIKAVRINGKPTEEFLKNLCNGKNKP